MEWDSLSLKVWFLQEFQNYLGFDLKLDPTNGRYFTQFEGPDAFDRAKLLPQGKIDLVALRQKLDHCDMPKNSGKRGQYNAQGRTKLVVEKDSYEDDRLLVSITARTICEAEEVYNLFRQGKLFGKDWIDF